MLTRDGTHALVLYVLLLTLPDTTFALRTSGSRSRHNPIFDNAYKIGGENSAFGYVNNGQGSLQAEFTLLTQNATVNFLEKSQDGKSKKKAVEICGGIAICDVESGVTRGAFFRRKQLLFIDSEKIQNSICLGQNQTESQVSSSGCYSFLISAGRSSLDAHFSKIPSYPSSNTPFPSRLDRDVGVERGEQITSLFLKAPLPIPTSSNRKRQIFVVTFSPCICMVSANKSSPLISLSKHAFRSSLNDSLMFAENKLHEQVYSLKYDLHMRNTGSQYPELGWEEAWFPVGTICVMALYGLLFGIVAVSLVTLYILKLPWKRYHSVGTAAAISKTFSSGLMFAYIRLLINTGKSRSALSISRLPVMLVADLCTAAYVMIVCIGREFIPASWFFNSRTGGFQICTAIFIETCIVLGNKIVFPYKASGAVLFAVVASAYIWLAVSQSVENAMFLNKYNYALYSSLIRPSSTPIPGLVRYFCANVVIIPVAWLAKLGSIIAADYCLRRPDLLWIALEGIDALLLLWYAIVLFPRSNFGLDIHLMTAGTPQLEQVPVEQQIDSRRERVFAQQGPSQLQAFPNRTEAVNEGNAGSRTTAAANSSALDDETGATPSRAHSDRNARRRRVAQRVAERLCPRTSSTENNLANVHNENSLNTTTVTTLQLDVELGISPSVATSSADGSRTAPTVRQDAASHFPSVEVDPAEPSSTPTVQANEPLSIPVEHAPRLLSWRPGHQLPLRWVSWRPGMPLPAPTPEMWPQQSRRRHEQRPIAQDSQSKADEQDRKPGKPLIVLGMPCGDRLSGADFYLKLGSPIYGPEATLDSPDRTTEQPTSRGDRVFLPVSLDSSEKDNGNNTTASHADAAETQGDTTTRRVFDRSILQDRSFTGSSSSSVDGIVVHAGTT